MVRERREINLKKEGVGGVAYVGITIITEGEASEVW
jgi:hypothetical protein